MPGPYTNIFDNTLNALNHLGGYAHVDGQTQLTSEYYNKIVGAINDVVNREKEQFNITNFGAKPTNSASQNRTAILLAIDAAEAAIDGGEVVIPPGTFLVDENGLGGTSNIPSFSLSGLTNPISFKGMDPQRSILKMDGSNYVNGAWYMFQIWGGASNVTFKDIIFDGNNSSFTNPDEQIHGIQPGFNGASKIYILNCEFRDFHGDGIRAGGEVATPTTEVLVNSCRFFNNNRSGITIQRNCREFYIVNSYFYGTEDQDIDFEPTGVGGGGPFVISGNIFKRRPDKLGTISITLSGNASDSDGSHRRSVFANNVLEGGSVDTGNLQDAVFANNVIYNAPNAAGGDNTAVLFRKTTSNCIISNNVIIQESNNRGMSFGFHTSSAPKNNVVANNTIHMLGDDMAIYCNGTQGMNIHDNIIIWDDSLTPYNKRAIGIDAQSWPCSNNSVHDNIFVGKWDHAVDFSSNNQTHYNISVYNNTAPEADTVVHFNASNYLLGDYPICFGNKGGVSKVIDGWANVKAIAAGGNVGNTVSGTTNGIVQLQSNGHPGTLGLQAPLGSTCIDITAASGTVLFVRQSGGNNVWTAK